MPLLSVLSKAYAYRTLVLIFLLAILSFCCYYLYQGNVQKEAEKQEIINLYAAAAQPLVRTVDNQGRETVRAVVAPISPGVLADLKAGLAAEMRDQLRKEFGRQAQLLYGQRTTTTTAQALPVVALQDTTVRRKTPAGKVVEKPAKKARFRDPWLTLTGLVLPGSDGESDSLQVNYSIRNEFDIRAYSKRDAKHWWQFWKPRRAYVDIKNKNPNTTTTGLESVKVEKQ
jgi:hypothetical protein